MTTLETPQQTPLPIPAPPDFPVRWESGDDERIFWTIDRMHFPFAFTPMNYSLFRITGAAGFDRAAASIGLPMRYLVRRINTYTYQYMGPDPDMPPPGSAEEAAEHDRRVQEQATALMARMDSLWADEQLPEVKRYLDDWAAFDLQGASLPEFHAHVEETLARAARLWEIHFQIAFPMLLSISIFDDLYRDLFGAETPFDSYRLLQGQDNKSLETGRALWRLSRRALAVPEVRTALEEQAAADVVPVLEQSRSGREFLVELRAFLEEYGQKSDRFMEVADPSWIEDPTPVIKNLKDYITQPDRDPEAELAAVAAERERLIATARAQLEGYPQGARDQFEFFLRAAQQGNVLQEDHNFWIDYRGMYRVRQVLLECGRRLAAAGVIDRTDDVFFLTVEEAREDLAALLDGAKPDRRSLVVVRRAELEHFRTVTPPPALGTPPTEAPPDNPFVRAIFKFFGAPPQPPTEAGVLRGAPGSPGTARGRAMVVRSLLEAGKLQPGDVLVAETTSPPWTPLFATVSAIVTDTGGPLSHCAVVAREYGVPAVVGANMATAIIQDGQTIEVDGSSGVVRIVG